MMPTRYTLDVDLKGVVAGDVLDNSTKRTEARKVRGPSAIFGQTGGWQRARTDERAGEGMLPASSRPAALFVVESYVDSADSAE